MVERCTACGRVLRNKTITEREKEVLQLLLGAKSNPEIGAALGITECTVKNHVSRLLRLTDSQRRIELAVKMSQPLFRLGLGISDADVTVRGEKESTI